MIVRTSRWAVGTAVVSAVLLAWDLGRPALWLDESASVVATQRSWPNVVRLLHGPDAPLVPYYVLLKLTSGTTRRLLPAAIHHPELVARWPSMVVAVPKKYLSTSSEERPMASKICAPQ